MDKHSLIKKQKQPNAREKHKQFSLVKTIIELSVCYVGR